MQKLLLFPCNGNTLEALDCINDAFEVIGFIDDDLQKQGTEKYGLPVFSREAFDKYKEAKILAAPGNPENYLLRNKIIWGLNIDHERFATVIHQHASISSLANIGYNVLVMAGVAITSNAVLGNHCCVLPNSVIHHDSIIGEFSLIGSNVVIAGNVKIGNNCYIGGGSNIINNIKIGDRTLIGMGSNVLKSFGDDAKIAGNPARQLL